MLVIRIYL